MQLSVVDLKLNCKCGHIYRKKTLCLQGGPGKVAVEMPFLGNILSSTSYCT